MDRSAQRLFLLLVLVQMAHATEEYLTRLYEVFAPAGYLSGLVSHDLGTGFVILNTTFIAFGLWCYFFPVRLGWPSARGFVWLWVGIELFNGVVHTGLALSSGAYFPGVVTAPVLFVIAAALAVRLVRSDPLPVGISRP